MNCFSDFELPYGWRGVTPHSEIIVEEKTPIFLELPCGLRGGITPFSKIIVGDKFVGTSSLGLPSDLILECDPFLS